MSENEIPPRFAGAATSLAEVRQWSDAVLSGAAARLVVLGPIWSGKTHTAYAAVGQLLRAGYPLEQIVVHQAHGLAIGGKYEPALIDSGPPVIVLDDVTGEVDNRAASQQNGRWMIRSRKLRSRPPQQP
ncbi:hypothetical protein [Actinomadura madurae]|uniref:hypothetical protein n=1 Tax=Actinomadura madurae TaxID=1993 RepID=UPI0020D22010|nr:hypothetical protein [Actinomadura madurae]MCQ0012640.1 hypothetical protein [Actinomadura madurae]